MSKAENTVTVHRLGAAGKRAREELRFPRPWEVTVLPARSPAPPLPEKDLPEPGSFALPPGKVVVVVNDAQRPTPTPWLLDRLSVDWTRGDLHVAVAGGSHPPPGEEELRAIFGPRLETVRPRLVTHRAGESRMVRLGRTSRGTPVEVNGCLEGAAAVVSLNSVEPHYFAGWTGGRKSIVPGLSSMETMRVNHRLALEGCAPGMLEGNPVHLDLTEGAGIVGTWLRGGSGGELLALNVIHTAEGFHGCCYGPLLTAVDTLAPRARSVFGRPLERTWPLVLCLVDPPLDRDLYQSLKAFENWKTAVSPGGLLVLAASCREGLGPPSFRQFTSAPPGLEELTARVAASYRLGDHKLVSFLRYRESGRDLLLLTDGPLPRGNLPLPAAGSLAEALSSARGIPEAGPAEALVVEDAGHCYPLHQGEHERTR